MWPFGKHGLDEAIKAFKVMQSKIDAQAEEIHELKVRAVQAALTERCPRCMIEIGGIAYAAATATATAAAQQANQTIGYPTSYPYMPPNAPLQMPPFPNGSANSLGYVPPSPAPLVGLAGVSVMNPSGQTNLLGPNTHREKP
jgi:hypothetical protein